MRGWFPAAYLFTIVAGLVASFFHLGGTAAPPVLAGLMTVLSSGVFAVALIGHVIALGRPDQRTLADLVSGSFVVLGPALPPPTDLEEFDEWKAHRRRVLRNVVVFEAVLALGVFALPWALTSAGGERPSQRAQRLKVEALEAKFAANPGSESLTAELQHELRLAGREADVRAVFEQHRQALSVKEANRELQLREQLAQTHERATAEALITLLEQQDRVEDAREVYLEWLGDAPAPSALAGFGHWLATNGKTEEAVEVLTRATNLDPLVPYGQTLLGVSLQRAGRLTLAREHLELALLDEPSDEDAADALREVEAKVGVLSAEGKRALRARFERWRRDAGR